MVISFHFSHKSSTIRVEAVETTAVHPAMKKAPCDFHPSHGKRDAREPLSPATVDTGKNRGWYGGAGVLGEMGVIAMLIQGIHQEWYSRRMIKEALRDDVLLGYGDG